jgi:hypothetical protein
VPLLPTTRVLSLMTDNTYMQRPPTNLPGQWLDRGWLPPKKRPPIKTWAHAVAQVASIFDSIHWWVGDIIEYGRYAYGEKYAQYADLFDYNTLTRDTWVCRSVPFDIRRPPFGPRGVSFSSHLKVAPRRYSIAQKDFWLGLASVEQWTVRQFERQLADNKKWLEGHYTHLELPGTEARKDGRAKVLYTNPKAEVVSCGKAGNGYIVAAPAEFISMAETETRLTCPDCGYRIPVFLPEPREATDGND